MAQYDLILTQNVAAAGIEFSEKYINIAKGALLSAATDGTPTVLAAGTDGYMLVRDNAETTGLKWVAISAGHTQNTDTGTTGATFDIDSDSTTGKIQLKAVANAGENHTMTVQNAAMAADVTLTLPATTGTLATQGYADGLFAANDAMIFKGTVGSGGTHEIAAFNSLATYNAGWTYRVIEAGTIKGKVCEIGDLVMAIVDRTGSDNVDGDWTAAQTNLDGAVIGPASTTDNYVALFSGATGKLLKAGSGALGTMAYETATSYVTKALFDAYSILFADSDDTPQALTVGASTIVGRKATGGIAALSPAEIMGVIQVTAPANKTAAGTVNQIAFDDNFFYRCKTTGTAGNAAWLRAPMATNW
jgi:hypothetical protein